MSAASSSSNCFIWACSPTYHASHSLLLPRLSAKPTLNPCTTSLLVRPGTPAPFASVGSNSSNSALATVLSPCVLTKPATVKKAPPLTTCSPVPRERGQNRQRHRLCQPGRCARRHSVSAYLCRLQARKTPQADRHVCLETAACDRAR